MSVRWFELTSKLLSRFPTEDAMISISVSFRPNPFNFRVRRFGNAFNLLSTDACLAADVLDRSKETRSGRCNNASERPVEVAFEQPDASRRRKLKIGKALGGDHWLEWRNVNKDA